MRRWPSSTLKKCYSLCQHMMHFFHQYLLYVTFEVLEPLWHTMSIQCRTANTLDEVRPSSLLPPVSLSLLSPLCPVTSHTKKGCLRLCWLPVADCLASDTTSPHKEEEQKRK